jgi:hypothetical protein
MKLIKQFLFFLCSAIYTSAWWVIFITPHAENNETRIPPEYFISFAFVVFTTLIIFLYIWHYLADNWDKEN